MDELIVARAEKPSDLTEVLINKFGHPATALWRTIEVSVIKEALRGVTLENPILDLGCAEGEIAEIIFRGGNIIGLDNCLRLLNRNKKTEVYKALFLADGCNMPYKGNAFGTVFSNCVIEHIPALDSLVSEVGRILKPNGVFIFTVPSHEFGDFLFFNVLFKKIGLRKLAAWYTNKRNALLNHYHCYNRDKWQSILKKYNLKVADYTYYMPKNAVMTWDFLAALFLVLNKIGVGAFAGKKYLNKLKRSVDEYSTPSDRCSGGGALLIIAQKMNKTGL